MPDVGDAGICTVSRCRCCPAGRINTMRLVSGHVIWSVMAVVVVALVLQLFAGASAAI